MKKTIFVFGSIAGVLVSLFVICLILFVSKNHDGTAELLTYSSMILALSLVYVGARSFRDRYNDGTISFGKALRVALGITLIASTIYVLVWLVEYYCFMPDFMDKYAAAMVLHAKSSGLSPEALQKELTKIEGMRASYNNPVVVILYTYLEILPVGIIISLLTALLVKRKRRPVPSAPAIA
jgi:Protein of unknown function (DUF4199)